MSNTKYKVDRRVINVSLPVEFENKLTKLAKDNYMTRSEAVRCAISNWIKLMGGN